MSKKVKSFKSAFILHAHQYAPQNTGRGKNLYPSQSRDLDVCIPYHPTIPRHDPECYHFDSPATFKQETYNSS